MKKILALLAISLVVACSPESGFPTVSGKGMVRAINAIPASPDLSFLIEERLVESISYKGGSTGVRYDDLEYIFNIDAAFPGESTARRLASKTQKIEPDRDYTFVATGTIEAPELMVWESDERTWADNDTVFQARFAHLARSLGSLDVHFAAPGVAPAADNLVGTIDFQGILPPVDRAAGDYVLTITSSGNPADIIYQTSTIAYTAQRAYIVPVFDGDELDVAPYNVRLIAESGAAATSLPDHRFPPTVRFMQASIDLPAADIYDDEMLTSQVLANQGFGDISADIPLAAGTTDFHFTPANNPGAVLFEDSLNAVSGSHNNFVVVGDDSDRDALVFIPDRRSVSTIAKVRFLQASTRHDIVDVYVVDQGDSISEANPTFVLPFKVASNALALLAGSFDVYLTVNQEKTILAGPVSLNLALGDVVEVLLLDSVDPSTATISVVPQP